MTEYVHLPNSTFAHDRMHLAPPNGLQGGAYFSMLYYKDTPLYIQTPVCTSRQGVVTGKRPYIDLMFSNHDVPFLEWLEAMEVNAVRMIYEKRNIWISSDIEKSDIEAGFTSPVRPYKGGKHYLIRAHIQPAKHLASASSSCSVFDENERPVPLEYIKPEHQMYTVLEFQGIKFTARSFQIDVSLKQVLIVPNVPLFQACVIRKHARIESDAQQALPQTESNETSAHDAHANESNAHETNAHAHESNAHETNAHAHETNVHETNAHETNAHESNAHETNAHETNAHETNAHETNAHETNAHETNAHLELHAPDDIQIQEINMDGLDELEHMHIKLKKPTEVYYNMYNIAKQKAKELKKNAIAAYLEAKQIKSAHMLEDSSDDSDEEYCTDDDE
jgi:hypothetical protein